MASDFSFKDSMGYLFGPWCFHKGCGWTEADVPDWARARLNEARLAASIATHGQASELEALIYLSSASATVPLGEPWVRIMQYLTGQVMGLDKVPEDLRVAELTPWELEQFNHLRHEIYAAVIKHHHLSDRQARKAARQIMIEPGRNDSNQPQDALQLAFNLSGAGV